jgi:hypothetical protein
MFTIHIYIYIYIYKIYIHKYIYNVHIYCTHAMLYCSYLLTPWCRVLLEKLTGLQLVKKFPAFYGTRRFKHVNIRDLVSPIVFINVLVYQIKYFNSGKWPTWHTVLFSCTFISILYMFWATLCLSSGESIVSVQLLVYVTLKTSEWSKITKSVT